MPNLAETSSYLAGLRARATTQLTRGIQGDPVRGSTSEAMGVLYRLASSPDTAEDALALLHELQVHQVEVDMQHEELRHSRVELERDLARQTCRFERAPAAFLIVDPASVVCEINRAGVRLLGVASEDVLGRAFTAFLTPRSGGLLKKRLGEGPFDAAPVTLELERLPVGGATRKLYATADRETSPDRFSLVLMEPPSPL